MLGNSSQEQVLLSRDLLPLIFSWLNKDYKSKAMLSMLCKQTKAIYEKNNLKIKNKIKEFLKLQDSGECLSLNIFAVYERIQVIEQSFLLQEKINKSLSMPQIVASYIKEFGNHFDDQMSEHIGNEKWCNRSILKYLDSPEFFEKNMSTKEMPLTSLQNSQAIAALLCNPKLVAYLMAKEDEYYPQVVKNENSWVTFFKKFNCIKGIDEDAARDHVSFKGLLYGVCLSGDKELFKKIFKRYNHQVQMIVPSYRHKFYDYLFSYAIRSKNLDFVICVGKDLNLTDNMVKGSIGAILLDCDYIESEEISNHYGLTDQANQVVKGPTAT